MSEISDLAKGRTIREAIVLAMEGLNGHPSEWVSQWPTSLRSYILQWVHDYAKNRGVILSDSDIDSELKLIVAEIKERC